MKVIRKYGERPYKVAVLHGGPGVAGEMAPVARELASVRGILEPLQTAKTILGQREELRTVLRRSSDPPFTLIGYSWGAWLGYLFAAYYPSYVKKLILVSCAGFKESDGVKTLETRLSRLDIKERAEVVALMEFLKQPGAGENKMAGPRLGELLAKADAYDPVQGEREPVEFDQEIHQMVWGEAEAMRQNGKLLELGRRIHCPVLAISGDHDPHPAESVQNQLTDVIKNFRFVLLEKCGHIPWLEKQARERFFTLLQEEIRD